MKLIILSLIISLSLHFLIIKSYTITEDKKKKEEISKVKKSDITYVKLKATKPEPIKEIVKEEISIPKVKKVQEKQKKVEVKKQVEIKKVAKESKPKKQNVHIKKAKEFQKKVLKEQIVKKEKSIQNKTLEDFLSQKEPVNQRVLNELERLYGREFQTYTKVQKAFLEKNLDNFQIITQRVLSRLGYPKLAAKLRIYGSNIVEFMFNPDGSISDLKITSSSGYNIFDSYTLELIEIAYKDYPKPKTQTKIKFNVNYTLY